MGEWDTDYAGVTAVGAHDTVLLRDISDNGVIAAGKNKQATVADLLAGRARRSSSRRKSRYGASVNPAPSVVVSTTELSGATLVSAAPAGVVAASGSPYRWEGAPLTSPFGTDFVAPYFAGASQSVPWRASVDFHGTAFGVKLFGGGYEFMVWVNDQPVLGAPYTLASDSSTYWANVTLPSTGHYRVTVELAGGDGGVPYFGGIAALPAYDIRPPADPSPVRVVVVGDSYGAGRGADGISSSPNPNSFYGYVPLLSQLLGVPDVWTVSIGGTGYVATVDGAEPYSGRASDVAAAAPDVVIVQGSINDGGESGVQAAAASFVSGLMASLPDAVIIMTGPLYAAAYYSDVTTVASEVSAAAAALGVPFIDASTWATGTGYAGDTNGSGTSDYYQNGDSVHPTPAGHQMLAQRMAAAVGAVLGMDVAQEPAFTPSPWSSAEPLAPGSGETLFPRWAPAGDIALASGQMTLTAWTAATSGVATSMGISTGSITADGMTACYAVVYEVDDDGNGTLVASTGDISGDSPFSAAYSGNALTLTSGFSRVAGKRYALGILVVASTPPSVAAMYGTDNLGQPWICGTLTESTPPDSFAYGDLAYAACLVTATLSP